MRKGNRLLKTERHIEMEIDREKGRERERKRLKEEKKVHYVMVKTALNVVSSISVSNE